MQAKKINEFAPDSVMEICQSRWLTVAIEPGSDSKEYKSLPEIVEYDGAKFYKMSFNSDSHKAYYKEAKDKPYHLRYAD